MPKYTVDQVQRDYDAQLVRMTAEHPSFKLIRKADSSLMRFIAVFLRIITLGWNNIFLTEFITTLGCTIYTPTWWDHHEKTLEDHVERLAILRHESVHMRQAQKLGRFKFTLMYLCWPLPAVYAIGRRKLEEEAYVESIRTEVQYFGVEVLKELNLKTSYTGYFLGPDYFWMCPFKSHVYAWYDDAIAQVKREINAPMAN
jgi:hypothetical protein